jgi:hypothetical protein
MDKSELLAALVRERFGDPATIERERPTHRPTDARPTSHAQLVERQDVLRSITRRSS